MTIIVANTANTNTFDYWRNRTNELADAMTNKTVTVDSNTATGNAAITGTFSATELSINESAFSSINVQTSGTSEQIVDNFDLTTYQAAEYVVSIKDNAANGYQVSKLILLHDTGDAYVTEYGVIYSNGMLGTFSANANVTHSRLTVTPTQSNTQLKISRTLIKV